MRDEHKKKLSLKKRKVKLSRFTNFVRGFNEDKFWKYYQLSRAKNIKKTFYTVLYMRMATKQCGYIGRETIFLDKPHFPHGLHGVHITRTASIGRNAVIYQGVTIGANADGAPTIGDNVMCGANAVIIGSIKIGNNVKIGAGAIVVDDIPDNCTVICEKATIIKRK